jgi:uncharacterized protein Yka (UPF0111/DUF47 family)
MTQLRFDENLAIREVLDDIVGMVDRREKLISSVDEQAEKTKDERIAQHVKKLEELMSDFLTLFEPILEKVRAYGENLKESISESEGFLKSLVGIIDAGKAIEGTSATLQELEKDADGVQGDLRQSTETLDKIQDLFKRTKAYLPNSSGSRSENSTSHSSVPRTRHAQTETDTEQGSRFHVLAGSRLSSYQPTKSQY